MKSERIKMGRISKKRYENNSLKEEIQKILDQKYKAKANHNDNYTFAPPIKEEVMTAWEQEHGITIPESYKEWLRFSRESSIEDTTANFWSPKDFTSEYCPDDLVIIGEMIGDGEFVCFSKETGKFVSLFEGERTEYDDFKGILNAVIRIIEPLKTTPEEIEQMKKKLKEIREKRNSHDIG